MVLRSKTNRFRMLALLVLAGTTLSACTPAPTPSPTPTAAFASEEEAFAAAEETYRAYNDAVNLAREEGESESPQEFLAGLALENDIAATRVLEANEVHITGEGEVTKFDGTAVKIEGSLASVEALVCLDVSATRLLDDAGTDVTPTDRAKVVALDVTFTASSDGLKISESTENLQVQC